MLKMTFNKWDGNAWEGPYKGFVPCPFCQTQNQIYVDPGENRIQDCVGCLKPFISFKWKSNPLPDENGREDRA